MLDPEIGPFLEEWRRRWAGLPSDATPAMRRARFEEVAAAMRLPTPEDVQTDDVRWVESAAGRVRVRVFRHSSDGVQPCLVYMHGGAWMQGSPETHWDITSRLAASNQQTVISVDYALAPEHPFPTAVNQCADVVRWAHANPAALDIDPHRIAVGGDSAGANIAAVLALIFRDSSIGLIGQLLIYPPVDFERRRPSYRENAEGPMITVASMPAVNAMYCPNPVDLRNPLAAPMYATRHDGLPPAFIAVAENDPLRDDGIDYAAKLSSAGVPTVLDRGPGLVHGYLRALEYCAASRDRLTAMCNWLSERNSEAMCSVALPTSGSEPA